MRRRTLSLAFFLLLAGSPLRAALGPAQPLPVAWLAPGGRFGAAVAVGSDVIAVGAYLAGGGAGAVYLFRQVDGQWIFLQEITTGRPGEQLGFDVAVSSDGDTLLASAPFAAVGGVRCGTVYRALRSNGSFGGLMPLGGLPCQAGAEVGSAVALAANDLIVVGARGAAGRAGRVYVGSGNGPFQEIGAAQTEAGDELGTAVATDGIRVLAGAPFATVNGQADAGKAVLFTGAGETWNSLILPQEPAARSAFGYAVAVSPNGLAVGAPLAGGEAGAVAVYDIGGNWIGAVPGLSPSGQLGVALSATGTKVYAGARWDGGGRGKGSGAVYPISLDALSLGGPLRSSPPVAGAEFGFDVAAANGVLVVGAFGEKGTGAAYVFGEPPPPVPVYVGLESVEARVGEDAGSVSITVVLTDREGRPTTSLGAVQVELATVDGTATAGSDYGAVTKTVKIPVGETRASSVTIPIYPDPECEGEETFKVQLSAPSGAALGTAQETVTIAGETAGLTLAPASLTLTKGSSSSITVTLRCTPAAPVSVYLDSNPVNGVILDPDHLTFSAGLAGQVRTVSVGSIDDGSCFPPFTQPTVVASATSADPRYQGLSSSPLHVTVVNGDLRCVTGGMQICSDAFGTVLYAIVLVNSGPQGQDDDPTVVELLDVLPPEVTVVSASADRGVATVDYAENSVAWNGPFLSYPETGKKVTIWITGALAPVAPGTQVLNGATLKFHPRLSSQISTVAIAPVELIAGSPVCDPAFPF